MSDDAWERRFRQHQSDVLAVVNRLRDGVREELRPLRDEVHQLKADHDSTMRLLHGDAEDPDSKGLVAIVREIGDSVRSFKGIAKTIAVTVASGVLLTLWNQWSIKS